VWLRRNSQCGAFMYCLRPGDRFGPLFYAKWDGIGEGA